MYSVITFCQQVRQDVRGLLIINKQEMDHKCRSRIPKEIYIQRTRGIGRWGLSEKIHKGKIYTNRGQLQVLNDYFIGNFSRHQPILFLLYVFVRVLLFLACAIERILALISNIFLVCARTHVYIAYMHIHMCLSLCCVHFSLIHACHRARAPTQISKLLLDDPSAFSFFIVTRQRMSEKSKQTN